MALVATVIVDNLATPDRWVDKVLAEAYSDSSLTTLVGVQYSDVTWNGTYNVQKDVMKFSGLVHGQTYWIRCGVMAQHTHKTVYFPAYQVIAGVLTAPNGISYSNINVSKGANGLNLYVSLGNVPSDIDEFQAFWTVSGSGITPVTDTPAMWRGHPVAVGNASTINFFIGGTANTRFDVWLRGINTAKNKQSWLFVGNFSVGTLDDVAEGGTFGKVRAIALNDGYLDPRRSGYLKLGSVNPVFVGAIQWENGVYDAANNLMYLKFFWNGVTLLRVDGGNTYVPDLPYTNAFLVYPLWGSTPYQFLPRYNEFNVNSPQTGNPIDFVTNMSKTDSYQKVAFRNGTVDIYDVRLQSLQDYQPLSVGPLTITTLAPGSSGGTTSGGGGGGGYKCVRKGTLVECKERGVVRAETVTIGEHILTPNGWSEVLYHCVVPCDEFIQLKMVDGEEVELDPNTSMLVNDSETKLAHELGLGDMIGRRDDMNPQLEHLKLVRKPKDAPDDGSWWKVCFTIEAPHWYYAGKHAPTIITHNILAGTC